MKAMGNESLEKERVADTTLKKNESSSRRELARFLKMSHFFLALERVNKVVASCLLRHMARLLYNIRGRTFFGLKNVALEKKLLLFYGMYWKRKRAL